MRGAQPETVSCTQWKRELSLNKKGKEGSRELALRLFPTAADMLKCPLSSCQCMLCLRML